MVDSKTWTVDDAASLYGIPRWSDDYFHISDDGHVLVSPDRNAARSIDLQRLVDRLAHRGLQLPVLIRFDGILRDRLNRLNGCFEQAISEYGYKNRYRCVFPIKVNQQSGVVRQIVEHGKSMGVGVEAGSKPELIAVVAMTDAETPIICNGFKDADYIRMALLAQQMGRTVFPVVEKANEMDLILRIAGELGVRPTIGMRVKLATRGTGRWQASGGYRSKFGLTVAEILEQLEHLQALGMQDCFQLLHFHVGSQIGNIRQLKTAILEASRIYTDLHKRGAGLRYLDVGGGLGVDYDGSRSDTPSSTNYTDQEYANDVVYHVQSVCDESGVPHPELLSESGRSIAAHHSVLVVETLGVASQGVRSPQIHQAQQSSAASGTPVETPSGTPRETPSGTSSGTHAASDQLELTEEQVAGFESPVRDLWDSYYELTASNLRESFHDAQVALDMCMNLFSGGYLPLEQRVAAEKLYFAICHRVQKLSEDLETRPDEFVQLDRMLSDIYFTNFSLFQSLPDAWAIDHKFPIMPIHRLNERPTKRGVLGDVTCDSDGKVDSFICEGTHRSTLRLHEPENGQSYRLGIFLVGAYQEILGDLHNLFGDTHAVHVDMSDALTPGGETFVVKSTVKGDNVREVLGYVQYDEREIVDRLEQAVESAVQAGKIDVHQAGKTIECYEKAISQYTYLTPESE